MAQPHNDETAASAGASDAIQAIRTLVDARDIRAAKQQLRRSQVHFDDPTWAMVGEIANTLRYKTHDVAITKLRKLWRDNEQHRALIEACAPKTDDRQYIPDNQSAAGRQTEGPRRPSGRVVRRVEPARPTHPPPRARRRAAAPAR
ncbi:hypothetical protein, partial [Nocardia brasiliensis]|uniref:hypothetical protein n=1 Tax=Nocardia brasiliensis TaxID=37326 RepID=UPI002458D63C